MTSSFHRSNGALAALVTAASLAGCGLHGKPTIERASAQGGAHPVAGSAAAPAREEPPGTVVVSPGIVEPWGSETALSAQEPGWIASLEVGEGDLVRAGQLLATLEDGAQRRAVDLARAELAEAAAARARLEAGATLEELRQARADLDAAAARSALARTAAARAARLHERGAIPDSEEERARAEAEAAAARADGAEARVAELVRGARAEDRAGARARVAAAQARLALAEANLARRRIVAPAAATVLLSRLHVGEYYQPAAGPIFVLGETARLQVRLEVDEVDSLDLAPGSPCGIYSDAGVPLAAGSIVRVAPRMGRRALAIEPPTSRTDVRVREVFVEIPAASKLVPGQRVWGRSPRTTAQPGSPPEPSRAG